jgi:hypothetical protein
VSVPSSFAPGSSSSMLLRGGANPSDMVLGRAGLVASVVDYDGGGRECWEEGAARRLRETAHGGRRVDDR